jgi:hypothetical protein
VTCGCPGACDEGMGPIGAAVFIVGANAAFWGFLALLGWLA